jgi:hypothetical protein
MSFTFHVDVDSIKALEVFAATKDVRFYLNGIQALATDPEHVRLCATDGSILAALRITRETDDNAGPFPMEGIIPRGAFMGMKGSVCVEVAPINSADNAIGGYSLNNGERTGILINGHFPDVMRVWPTNVSMQAADFDLALVGRIAKAAEILSGKRSRCIGRIFPNGDHSPATFAIRDDFAGVIMPIRSIRDAMPDWTPTIVNRCALKENAKETALSLRDLYDLVAAGVLPKPTDSVLIAAKAALLTTGLMTLEQIAKIGVAA